jgi:hypothetical protein
MNVVEQVRAAVPAAPAGGVGVRAQRLSMGVAMTRLTDEATAAGGWLMLAIPLDAVYLEVDITPPFSDVSPLRSP